MDGTSTAFLATVILANLLTVAFGLVPVGFGLVATAGTYAAGLGLCLRDAVHDQSGARAVLVVILLGAALSAVASPVLAAASAIAFLLSELADFLVYRPLRERGRWRAVAASNAVGGVVDTLMFLALAGLRVNSAVVGGQLLVKTVWVTGTYLLVSELIRRALPRQRVKPVHT